MLKDSIHILRRKCLRNIETYIIYCSNKEDDQGNDNNKKRDKNGKKDDYN